MKRSGKGTLDFLVGYQGELCGRVGLEEILALGSGLTRDAPHPTPRSRKTQKTRQNVAGGPSLVRRWSTRSKQREQSGDN